jgi:hypothetical protein
MEDVQITAFINEGYMRLKPILYPCTIEFSLMCLTVREVFFSNKKIRTSSLSSILAFFSYMGKYW